MADDTHFMSVRRMADALRGKELSAVELAEAHLDRIEALDGAVGSYLARTPELAREQAAAADAALYQAKRRGRNRVARATKRRPATRPRGKQARKRA